MPEHLHILKPFERVCKNVSLSFFVGISSFCKNAVCFFNNEPVFPPRFVIISEVGNYIVKGTFINSPQKGEIKIVKTSYDNKVEGIHFEVTGKTYTGQTFKKTYTTDKNGIIRINDLRAGEYTIHEVKDSASAGYLLPEDKQLTIDRDGAMLVANMHNSKLPDNPPTGASEDSFTQTAVIIISMVMMSAAVVLVFPLSKRKMRNR